MSNSSFLVVFSFTVCSRSLDPCYIVSYYIVLIWFSDLKDEDQIIYDLSTDDEAGGDPPGLPKQHVR